MGTSSPIGIGVACVGITPVPTTNGGMDVMEGWVEGWIEGKHAGGSMQGWQEMSDEFIGILIDIPSIGAFILI